MRSLRSTQPQRPLIGVPLPGNITIAWNFGRILGLVLGVQIVSGFFLRIHYTADITNTFNRVIHIVRDVPGGWFFRTVHANGARLFFFFMFLHIGRGLYYQRYFTQPKVWLTGVRLLLISMGTAFLGYVLPWGQMSLWGATVITNLIRAVPFVGGMIVEWVWGSFRVGQSTLNRFYSLHFILPFAIRATAIIHLYFLHENGSTNPIGDLTHINKVMFAPYFVYKDVVGFLAVFGILACLVFYLPYSLGDPENFIKANPIVTPVHIMPEWYFLFAYAILRVIPRKLGGVIGLVFSIAVLYFFPLFRKFTKPTAYNAPYQVMFWGYVSTFLILTWLGGCPIEDPYTTTSALFSRAYFILVGSLMFLAFFLSLTKTTNCHFVDLSGGKGRLSYSLNFKAKRWRCLYNSCLWQIAQYSQLNLMDGFSNSQLEMNLFHDTGIVLIIGIFAFVTVIGTSLICNNLRDRKLLEDQALETVWTVIPAVLLVFLALPSLRLLYLVDDTSSPNIVGKSIGHQWYWRYERVFGDQRFDAYMAKRGAYRNLDVDNRFILDSNRNVQIITTSADVLHSWAVPSLGVKMDSVPGRLNTIMFNSRKTGVIYGQCSEICGANHSFMPIVVEVVFFCSILVHFLSK